MSDFKYAVRTFIRNPGFTAVVIVTLGLGIGATTAIFSVVNAVLIQPLPYRDADRLFATQASLPDYQDLAASTQAFDATASWASNLYNLATGTDTRQVLGGTVTRSLLPLLGAEPIIGRNFTAEDETRPTLILSDSLWRTQFGGDAHVLGRSVQLHPKRSRRNDGHEVRLRHALLLRGRLRPLHRGHAMLRQHAKLRPRDAHLRLPPPERRQPPDEPGFRWLVHRVDDLQRSTHLRFGDLSRIKRGLRRQFRG